MPRPSKLQERYRLARLQAGAGAGRPAAETLADLVEATYGATERALFSAFEMTREHHPLLEPTITAVLTMAPPVAGACTYLTAAWVGYVRTKLQLPVVCTSGDLRVRGLWAFRSTSRASADEARVFDGQSEGWGGHCWMQLGPHFVGDISIFRTAREQPDGSNLRAAVLDTFGSRGGFIKRHADLAEMGFEYIPKYVLSDDQVDALIRGAMETGRIRRPEPGVL